MDPAYYVAAGSLKARSTQLDVVSNNLANANTVGYKPERSFFTVFNKAQAEGRGLPYTKALNDGAVFAQQGTDFAQGALKVTGRPLDLAVEGNGFFMVQTPQGVQATRDGRFRMGPGGRLETLDGAPLLGKNSLPITVNPSGGPLTILPDGTVTQDNAPAGELGLKAFKDTNLLVRTGAGRFAPPAGAVPEALKGTVVQGSLEQSTVDLPSLMVDMIKLNRVFEMSMKVASTLSNDMDARVISDIASGR
jgi:flagellar basal-body rod protein FlgF